MNKQPSLLLVLSVNTFRDSSAEIAARGFYLSGFSSIRNCGVTWKTRVTF